MNRRDMMVGASVVTTGLPLSAMRYNATDFGVLGDGVADDAAAIQKVLDHAGRLGA
jgi:polygalacturonase